MFNPGLTDAERVLLEQNRELRKLVREMGELFQRYLDYSATRMTFAVNAKNILSRPEVREIMEESDG